MANPLTAFNGKSIYLDTMLPYALLRGVDPTIKPFFEKVRDRAWIAYSSVLTFDELAYRFVLALIKEK